MNNRLKFFALATPIIWLVVVAPFVILLCWWLSAATLKTLGWSLLAAPIVTISLALVLQTSNLSAKFIATQLIGVCTVLMNVVIFSSPLLWVFTSNTVALVATAACLLITGYAVWKALSVNNTKLVVRSDKLNQSLRIMHLSDLHAGSRSKAFISRMVKQTNEHKPDIVLITGDLIDSSAVDSVYLAPLAQLTCPVYLCLGNHERYVNLENAINAIKLNNVQILRSETVVNGELQITGIDDDENRDQVNNELGQIARDSNKYQILMYHRPDGFEDAAAAGIDLMLCGHTHAGQMWPFGLLVKRRFPYLNGRFTHNNATLFVSQGTGTWGPTMRLGTSSEMTLIEALPAQS